MEEEAAAFDTSLESAIHAAPLLSEDLAGRDREIDELASKYSDVFKNREDAVYFAMLPLSAKDRVDVLARARELEKENLK
jgi:hypothetical protein